MKVGFLSNGGHFHDIIVCYYTILVLDFWQMADNYTYESWQYGKWRAIIRMKAGKLSNGEQLYYIIIYDYSVQKLANCQMASNYTYKRWISVK